MPFKVVAEYKGPDLVGMHYEQLFPWVKPVEMDADGNFKNAADKAFRVIAGDYVTTDDGTGIVHIVSWRSVSMSTCIRTIRGLG